MYNNTCTRNTYKVKKDGIHLAWAASISKDIKTHYLYRNKIDEDNWQVIYQTEDLKTQDAFIDNSTETGATYEYKIVAEDDDGLKTNGVQNITLTAIDFEGPKAVKKIVANTTNQQTQMLTYLTIFVAGYLVCCMVHPQPGMNGILEGQANRQANNNNNNNNNNRNRNSP